MSPISSRIKFNCDWLRNEKVLVLWKSVNNNKPNNNNNVRCRWGPVPRSKIGPIRHLGYCLCCRLFIVQASLSASPSATYRRHCYICMMLRAAQEQLLWSIKDKVLLYLFITPPPIHRGRAGYCFRSISLFMSLLSSLLARLGENGWTDLHEIFREGVEQLHRTTWLHFWSIPRNRVMPRCAARGRRGWLCFSTTACSFIK